MKFKVLKSIFSNIRNYFSLTSLIQFFFYPKIWGDILKSNEPTRLKIKEEEKSLCLTAGAVIFSYTNSYLFDESHDGFLIFEKVAGLNIFRIVRDEQKIVKFYHSSPSCGTRVASIDLNKIKKSKILNIRFKWCVGETALFISPEENNGKYDFTISKGIPSGISLRTDRHGVIYTINSSAGVKNMTIYEKGKPILLPTALEAWEATVKSVNLLVIDDHDIEHHHEVVTVNMILVMLVAGFESYSKRRFFELEQEGLKHDTSLLINSFLPKREIENGISEILEEEANELGISLLNFITNDKRIVNFQSMDKCKKAYNKTYGIVFGDFDLKEGIISKIRMFMKHRHRIIHFSASESTINHEEFCAGAEPIFSNIKTANEAINIFNQFIMELHKTTIEKIKQQG